jgi:hypothetical protein
MGANHEELARGTVRYECKAGKAGGANSVWLKYLVCENQSEASRPIGDNRPFVAAFEPDGTSEGLIVFRRSKLPDVVSALAEQLGGA